VTIHREDDELIIKPKHKPDLTDYFDSIVVDVTPKAFNDPHKLTQSFI